MDIALEITFNIIVLGALYGLATIGFSIIFSVTKILHIAQGAVVLASAYVFLWFVNTGVNALISIILALTFSAILGYVMNTLVYEKLRRKGGVSVAGSLIASIGLLFIIQNVILIIFGARIKSIDAPFLLQNFKIGGALVSLLDIIIVDFAI